MYRKRTVMSKKLAAARASKSRQREEGKAPEYLPDLPALRRTIVVTDHDFGEVTHRLELYRTNRRDCYLVIADGVEWKKRAGWSQILASLRKSLPRVGAQ